MKAVATRARPGWRSGSQPSHQSGRPATRFKSMARTAIPTSTRSDGSIAIARAPSFTKARAKFTNSCRPIMRSGTVSTDRRGASCPRIDRRSRIVMDSDLSLEFLRVVEQAAIACAHTMGQGDRHKSDQVAVEAMRKVMDSVPIDGTIVIGEGERDEAPMLYIGEKVGLAHAMRGAAGGAFPQVDIAVDPLEGTNLCATGAPNAIAVLAASTRGGLLHAPDLYMEKLVVGPSSKDHVSLDAPVHENLKAIAGCLGRSVEDLVVIVL